MSSCLYKIFFNRVKIILIETPTAENFDLLQLIILLIAQCFWSKYYINIKKMLQTLK